MKSLFSLSNLSAPISNVLLSNLCSQPKGLMKDIIMCLVESNVPIYFNSNLVWCGALGITPQILSKPVFHSLALTHSVHADTVMRFMFWYSEDMRMKFTIPRNHFKMFLSKHHNVPHYYLLLCMWWPFNWNYHFPFSPLFLKIQVKKNSVLKNFLWLPQAELLSSLLHLP